MATFSNSTNRRATTVQEQERNANAYEIVQSEFWYLRESGVTNGSINLSGQGITSLESVSEPDISVPASASISLTGVGIGSLESVSEPDIYASQDLGSASISINTSASATIGQLVDIGAASITVDLLASGDITVDENAITAYSGNVGNDMALNITLSGIIDIEVPPADPESQFELIKLRGFKMNTPVIGSDGKPT